MQPSGREMQGGGGGGGQDDFLDQMLSTLPPAWPDLGYGKSSPWELPAGPDAAAAAAAAFDETALLASRLRHHQIGGVDEKPLMLHHSDLHGVAAGGGDDAGFMPLPLFTDRAAFKSPNAAGGDRELYNGFGAAGMHTAAVHQPPPFGQGGSMPAAPQSFGGGGPAPAAGAASGGGVPPRQQRQRAKRGQATDPHSIAERLRRERIAERMKALQELVPNANKTDKASMLDEIIDYVKFLQLQVKVLSMSRLGGAAAVGPLVASMASEGDDRAGNGTSDDGGDGATNGDNGGGGGSLRVTEQQVARLMEEDMGTAMQYLQGKGLCLMPISLASAISSSTSSSPPPSLLPRPSVGSVEGARGPLHDDSGGDGGDDGSRIIKYAGAGGKQ